MIPVILKEKWEVAKNTLLYAFERPKDFSFLAGQYVSIKVLKTPFRDDRGNFRVFSIASAPSRTDVLEFAMRRSDSAFKKNLESLEVGEMIEITPATGKFVFGEPDAEKGIVFLVGGVGITPARSMLTEANVQKRPEKFFLLDSNRTLEETAFMEEMKALKDIDLVQAYTMTNQDASKKEWDGETSRIDATMVKKYVTLPWEKCSFFIVGVGFFVQSMKEMLLAEGVAPKKIYSDDFGGGKK